MPATVIPRHCTTPSAGRTHPSSVATPVAIVGRLKEASDAALRWQASLSLNWALLDAGLVDRLQVTIFPVISGQTGDDPIFAGAADFDLDLLESRTLDGRTQELTYRPILH